MTHVYTMTFIGGQKIKVSEKTIPGGKYFLDEAMVGRKDIFVKVGKAWINPDNVTAFTVEMVDK